MHNGSGWGPRIYHFTIVSSFFFYNEFIAYICVCLYLACGIGGDI